jgi:TonB family protein
MGGNVQAAKLIKRVHPVYPADLKEQEITGTVMLRAVISTTGETLNPEVVNTVDPGLAQAALDAFRQWRYSPTLLNGQPVEVAITATMGFELEQ